MTDHLDMIETGPEDPYWWVWTLIVFPLVCLLAVSVLLWGAW